MGERMTIDVGAQWLGGPVRLTVLGTGTDDGGPYALIAIGSHPSSTKVRLRAGSAHPLPGGGTLRLGGIAPAGHRPAVALEITDPGGDAKATS